MILELNQFRDVDLVIDKANDNFIQRQFVSQGDYRGRTLTVQVTDNGLIGQVPGLMLNLRWQNQASGLADLSAFVCIDEKNSIFRIEYPEQMMTPGKVIANIQVIQNGKVTHLKSFELTVQNLAGEMMGIVGKAEYSALVAVLSDANKFRTDILNLDIKKADKESLNNTIDEINRKIENIPKGNPSGSFATVADLKAEYPNGNSNIYVVTADGNWYYWDGADWIAGGVYQGIELAEKTVSPEKTTFYTSSKNIADYQKMQHSKKITGEATNVRVADDLTNGSAVIIGIDINQSTDYVANFRGTWSFRNDDLTVQYANYLNIARGISVKSPENATKLVISIVKTDADYPGNEYIQIESNKNPTSFEKFYNNTAYPEKPESANRPNLFIKKLPHLLNGERMFNGTAFIQDNVTSFNGYQYVVYWGNDRHPYISKRKIGQTSEWETTDLVDTSLGQVVNDGHNSMSIGIANDGYIHISGNMHANLMKYIVSESPEDIASFKNSAISGTGGTFKVCYPKFVRIFNGGALAFLWREEGSSNGHVRASVYSAANGKWADRGIVIDGKTTSMCPYIAHVAVDSFDRIHLAGTWRDNESGNTNHDIFHCYSDDRFQTPVKNSNGVKYSAAPNYNTMEKIITTEASGSGILNQFGLECDEDNYPHIAYFKYDENGNTNIYHLWQDKNGWQEQRVTDFDQHLTIGSAWSGLLSRPSILCANSKVYIIYRVNFSPNANSLRMIDVTPENAREIDFPILDLDLGHYEPTFDTARLYSDRTLSMLITKNNTNNTSAYYTNQFGLLFELNIDKLDLFASNAAIIPHLSLLDAQKSIVATSATETLKNVFYVPDTPTLKFLKVSYIGSNTSAFKITSKLDDVLINETGISANTETTVIESGLIPIINRGILTVEITNTVSENEFDGVLDVKVMELN